MDTTVLHVPIADPLGAARVRMRARVWVRAQLARLYVRLPPSRASSVTRSAAVRPARLSSRRKMVAHLYLDKCWPHSPRLARPCVATPHTLGLFPLPHTHRSPCRLPHLARRGGATEPNRQPRGRAGLSAARLHVPLPVAQGLLLLRRRRAVAASFQERRPLPNQNIPVQVPLALPIGRGRGARTGGLSAAAPRLRRRRLLQQEQWVGSPVSPPQEASAEPQGLRVQDSAEDGAGCGLEQGGGGAERFPLLLGPSDIEQGGRVALGQAHPLVHVLPRLAVLHKVNVDRDPHEQAVAQLLADGVRQALPVAPERVVVHGGKFGAGQRQVGSQDQAEQILVALDHVAHVPVQSETAREPVLAHRSQVVEDKHAAVELGRLAQRRGRDTERASRQQPLGSPATCGDCLLRTAPVRRLCSLCASTTHHRLQPFQSPPRGANASTSNQLHLWQQGQVPRPGAQHIGIQVDGVGEAPSHEELRHRMPVKSEARVAGTAIGRRKVVRCFRRQVHQLHLAIRQPPRI
eukprot:scaffold2458_cov121-Isochrysis_galbana.AAC.15